VISWISLYPDLYRSERHRVESNYPTLQLCTSALETGDLQYHGDLLIRGSRGTTRHRILFTYPTTFPYQAPLVQPVVALPDREPHSEKLQPLLRSARHQMAYGVLCLIESDPFRSNGEIIGGIDILRRAEAWFFAVESGMNPYDSPEAELEAHMNLGGHILVGPEFYGQDLEVGGSFYATHVRVGNLVWLLGVAISSDLANLAMFRDSRKTLARPFPWIRTDLWDAAQRIVDHGDNFADWERTGIVKGIWFDLPSEPSPPQTGAELLAILAESGHGDRLTTALNLIRLQIWKERDVFVGLRFINRKTELEWLFTSLKLRQELEATPLVMTEDQKQSLISRAPLFALRSHSLLPRLLMLRNERRIPEALELKNIALLGGGALGSTVGDLFAKAGVGTLSIFDKDIMEVGNAIRHVAGIESFGLAKADATALTLVQHNPFCDIRVGRADLLKSFETIESALSNSDFAVSTVADESVESAINEVATRIGKTVYYVRAMRGGAVGRIFRVIPGRDACRYCLAYYVREGPTELSEWLNVIEQEDMVLGFECGNPIIASSGADLSMIASLTVKLVLDDLSVRYGAANHWLWTTEVVPDHPALLEPYKLSSKTLPRFAQCPFCSDPPIKRIVLPSSIRTFMSNQAAAANGSEVCGVLLGHFDENQTVEVVYASDAGPKAKSTPTGCWRDVDYVQQWVDNKLGQGNDKLRYVGEWHSHPTLDTRPSHVDVDSLSGIATSQNYLCPTPIMVVLGRSTEAEEKLSGYSFTPGRPYREVAVEVLASPTETDETPVV
jgi:integrative and conjugative element protein (TIGR02256 family)